MATLLKWVGGIWAVLGVLNVLSSLSQERSEIVLAWSLILNMLIYIFPGLVLLGIGSAIESRSSTPEDFAVRAEDSLRINGETIRPASGFSRFVQTTLLIALAVMIPDLLPGGRRFDTLTLKVALGIGLIGGFLAIPLLKARIVSIAVQDREKFLTQAKKWLGFPYRQIKAKEDIVTYTPLGLSAFKVFIRFKGDTATIMGPKDKLKKLRKLEQPPLSSQGKNRSFVGASSKKSSPEIRLTNFSTFSISISSPQRSTKRNEQRF
jgi:hypothetical protein